MSNLILCSVYIYIYTTMDIRELWSVYVLYIQYKYIYIYLKCSKNERYIIVFGSVHSNRTVVVPQHNTLVTVFFNFSSIITNCKYTSMSKPNIMAYVILCSPFSSRLIASILCSGPIVLLQVFTWIEVVNVDIFV
jgi:hypothetical protein